ncbi:MAG: DUF3368 domain-containing protein [Betaproteobacteria bacterium]|nr:DUF3368 domain-containing protein [Betaproteobacteria bacterium]
MMILDDFAARRVARRLGVEFIGTAGVIVEAKRTGLIDRAAPTFERMTREGCYLSDDLIRAILAELGEH